MNALIVVQARMTSTRLPGKVLRPILGRPILSFQIERLLQVKNVSGIVVATTTNDSDEPIVDFCKSAKINVTRGSEPDVLSRFFSTALEFQAQTIVRVTADCPLLDPEVVDKVLLKYTTIANSYDYVSNMLDPTFPYGMAVEVMSFSALKDAHEHAKSPAEREHVTPYIYWHPERYRLASVTMSPNLSHHRWTVDTSDDFELVRQILETLYPVNSAFRISDILSVMRDHPTWQLINSHVAQKVLTNIDGCSDVI